MCRIQPQLPGEPRERKLSFNYLRCFASNATASYGWSILVSWFLWTHPHFYGTIHIQIPTVSGSKWCPRGYTSGWSKASLKIFDFPFQHGPAIDTTHTQDLHIGNVMKHILINIDKTPVVVNHSLKLRFKQSHQFFYMGIQRNLLAVITGWPNLMHESPRLRCSPEEEFKSQKRSFF